MSFVYISINSNSFPKNMLIMVTIFDIIVKIYERLKRIAVSHSLLYPTKMTCVINAEGSNIHYVSTK